VIDIIGFIQSRVGTTIGHGNQSHIHVQVNNSTPISLITYSLHPTSIYIITESLTHPSNNKLDYL